MTALDDLVADAWFGADTDDHLSSLDERLARLKAALPAGEPEHGTDHAHTHD